MSSNAFETKTFGKNFNQKIPDKKWDDELTRLDNEDLDYEIKQRNKHRDMERDHDSDDKDPSSDFTYSSDPFDENKMKKEEKEPNVKCKYESGTAAFFMPNKDINDEIKTDAVLVYIQTKVMSGNIHSSYRGWKYAFNFDLPANKLFGIVEDNSELNLRKYIRYSNDNLPKKKKNGLYKKVYFGELENIPRTCGKSYQHDEWEIFSTSVNNEGETLYNIRIVDKINQIQFFPENYVISQAEYETAHNIAKGESLIMFKESLGKSKYGTADSPKPKKSEPEVIDEEAEKRFKSLNID